MGTIYKRELKSMFSNMIGYVAIGFILLIVGIYSNAYNFQGLSPQFENVLYSTRFYLAFIIPILTMRSFADERAQKTDLLLYSLPISSSEVVLGKYLSMLTVYAIPSAVMMIYPLILSIYGSVNLLAAYSAIFAFLLLGAALIAVGMFMSSLTDSQLIAAVLGIAALVFCYLAEGIAGFIPDTAGASLIAITAVICLGCIFIWYMTKNYVTSIVTAIILEALLLVVYKLKSDWLAGLFPSVIKGFSVFEKTSPFFAYQTFDITSVVYYLAISAVFIVFTVQSYEKRRWC